MTAPAPDTTRWWARALGASHHEPRLAGALLGGRSVRYAIHRLRGFALARGAGAALYVLEASVLLRVLPPRTAILAFIASHVSTLVGGVWWGATEVQRIAIRDARDPGEADRVTAAWLAWAMRLGAGALVASGAVALAWRHRPVPAAYALVLGVRVAADLPLRVWHARISATRRIYRRMWMQLAVEATGPVLVLALHGHLGVWGFFAAMVASSAMSRATTWYFIRRAYATARLQWIRPARRAAALPWAEAASWGLAGVATRVPSVLGVMFLAAPDLPITVAIGFHLTVGALSAAGGWAWAHYADFVALAQPIHARLRARLARLVAWEAVAVAIVVGAAVLAIVYLAAPRTLEIREPGVLVLIPPKLPDPWPYAEMLPALALGFSALAASQVLAWTRHARAAVIASGVIACLAIRYAGSVVARVVGVAHVGHDLAATTVRADHLAMGGALVLCALGLWVASRGSEAPRDPRLPWRVARLRADANPTAVVQVHALGAGGLARALEVELARRGATWWSRKEHSWLIAGLPETVVREVGLACAGMVGSVSRYAPGPSPSSSSTQSASPSPTPSRTFRFDRPAPRCDLSEHEIHQIWAALHLHLAGARAVGPVRVVAVDLDGEAIVGCTAQLRR